MKMIELKSPAKINLTLEITGKKPSGMHSLRSVMIKTNKLFDQMKVCFGGKKISIICDDKKVPTDEKNTCFKIAENFFKKSKKRIGIKIIIQKRIPPLSGLGGGSSNAGILLPVINKYFKNILSEKELLEIASQTGSDIPFFLKKENAIYVTGTGEKLKPLKNFPSLNLLIVNCGGEIGTGWAYQKLDEKMWFMTNKKRKNISQKITAIALKKKENEILLYNDFLPLAGELFPIIHEIRNFLISSGACDTSITGKGPTVFGIFKSKKEVCAAEKKLKEKYPNFFITKG